MCLPKAQRKMNVAAGMRHLNNDNLLDKGQGNFK